MIKKKGLQCVIFLFIIDIGLLHHMLVAGTILVLRVIIRQRIHTPHYAGSTHLQYGRITIYRLVRFKWNSFNVRVKWYQLKIVVTPTNFRQTALKSVIDFSIKCRQNLGMISYLLNIFGWVQIMMGRRSYLDDIQLRWYLH